MTETINTYGWKGKDKIEIKEATDNYMVIEHRQEKKEGNVETLRHIIPKRHVNNLMSILSDTKADHTGYRYRDVIASLIKYYNLDIDLDAFNGGKNRALYYFPYYYWPVKILEAKGVIEYSGRGTISLIYGAFL